MIVQPDFVEHWKTRQLVELTGDESAPLAVIRLWAHCQHNRRSIFPEMTPAQLASICRWNNRKPACHVALVRCGFVEKLSPKGFAAHEWNQHNAQLIQKWHAGEKGGRPPKSENPDESGQNQKPDDNRTITGTKPDKTRSDQTRSEKIEKTSPDQTPAIVAPTPKSDSPPTVRTDGIAFNKMEMDGIGGIARDIAASKSASPFSAPSLHDVRNFLRFCFKGAEKYAEPFLKAMTKSKWRDQKGALVQDWKAMAKAYANKAELNNR